MPTLVSTRTSDSGLQASLHPLVLLTISDHIARHALRNRKTPIVGAILGQQIGRHITLEHAFECDMIPRDDGGFQINQSWFADRLQQYKDVHKDPALDLTGWFATSPSSGLLPDHARYQQQMEVYNESVLFLAFEPTAILKGKTVGGKLPLVVYESVYETITEQKDKDAMVIDNQGQSGLLARFRELPYNVETGEAEMIGVDFVARGGGNAFAADTQGNKQEQHKGQASQAPVGEGPSTETGEEKETGVPAQEDSSYLSPEDDERKHIIYRRVRTGELTSLNQSLPRSQPARTPSRCYNPGSLSSNHTSLPYRPATSMIPMLPMNRVLK